MANPTVLFENTLLESGTLSLASGSTDASFPLTNIHDWRYATAYRWKTGSTAQTTIHIDYSTTAATSALAIGGHNMHTNGATVRVRYSDNDADWTNAFAAYDPPSDKPFIVTWTETAVHRYWEIEFLNAAWSEALQVGICTLGRRLDFEGGTLADLDPYGFTPVVDGVSAESGSPIGVNVRYQEKRFQITYGSSGPGMTRDSYFAPSSGIGFDDDFQPHLESGKPFWFAWNTDVADTQQVYLCRLAGGVQMPFYQSTKRRSMIAEFVGWAEVS